MGAASQARRLRPDADELRIDVFEKGTRTSYALCGIPYVVAGEIDAVDDLVVRTPEQFKTKQDIDVHVRHEVVGIDVAAGAVEVRDLATGQERREPYDQLLIATGAVPIRPPLPGIDRPEVHGVTTLDEGSALRQRVELLAGRRAVIVGGGYIGLEVAEALLAQGLEVVVVDVAPQVMRTLDPEVAAEVEQAMVRHGIDVRTGVEVTGFEPDAVHTVDGPLPADLIVLGIGVGPNAALAADAGLELGARGAVRVDDHQRASAAGVFAAGDCADSHHLVSGERVHVALGTVANRQARVAGINLAGGDAVFPGVLGSAVTRFVDLEIGRTGLTDGEAVAAGLEPVSTVVTSRTTAGYYPGGSPVTVKLVAERGTGRLLGGQIVGGAGAAKRIDAVAVALTAGMSASALRDTDFSYAPPLSPVWDPVQQAARRLADHVNG